jgi:hypothetical protein
MAEALQREKRGMELDPFARSDASGCALIRTRRFYAALNEARIRINAMPKNPDLHYFISCAYFFIGMKREPEHESERYLHLADEKDLLAEKRVYRRGGFQGACGCLHGAQRRDYSLSGRKL